MSTLEPAVEVVRAAETAVGIPPWLIPVVSTAAAALMVGAGVYAWDLHQRGIQAKKDAPVVQAAQTQAAVSEGHAQITTKQQDNSQALTAVLNALAKKSDNAIQSVQAAPSDDAAWDAYLAGLRDSPGGEAPVGNLHGGSPASDAPSWPNPTHSSDPA